MDAWREFLYPFGFISSLIFGARILVQWLSSELSRESVVSKLFWQLSIFGNLFLAIHSLIQVQYHVFIIQVGNAVISWRNLNLMVSSKVKFQNVLFIFASTLISSTVLFFLLNDLSFADFSNWFRTPTSFLTTNTRIIPFAWHLVGIIGLTAFSSRFWIQWINSERERKSVLGASFWWISLIGDLLILVYFAKIKDPVNLIGPAFGLIPYIRNLMLIKNSLSKSIKQHG